ncbi:uncharacterized protein [Gossypium hirsutum]|uniref:Retrotransposon gag domain-containing protein n=1 Tax=Gossypium hirsutum TaxID=3635 RepID=A0A1U8L315_GOSHI|nr:uncharacterized protein LOC107923367 [Gossypium hirsutum]
MSTRGTHECGICGRGRGRTGARAESSSLGSMPNLDSSETPVLPAAETGSVTRVAPTVAEYWLEATKRIMSDIDCTLGQKLKGAVSLLRNEAYQWWLSIEEGTQPNRLNWDFFKTASQGKYMGASYVDARKREFMNLTQCDRFVVEYEAEFLMLSRYARGILASKYKKCVQFEDGLRDSLTDSLRVLIAPQRE